MKQTRVSGVVTEKKYFLIKMSINNFFYEFPDVDVQTEVFTNQDEVLIFPISTSVVNCLHKNVNQIYESMEVILQTLQLSLLLSLILFGLMIIFICKSSKKNNKKNVQVVQALPLTIEKSEIQV